MLCCVLTKMEWKFFNNGFIFQLVELQKLQIQIFILFYPLPKFVFCFRMALNEKNLSFLQISLNKIQVSQPKRKKLFWGFQNFARQKQIIALKTYSTLNIKTKTNLSPWIFLKTNTIFRFLFKYIRETKFKCFYMLGILIATLRLNTFVWILGQFSYSNVVLMGLANLIIYRCYPHLPPARQQR